VATVPGVVVSRSGEVQNDDSNMDAEFASSGPMREPMPSAQKPMPSDLVDAPYGDSGVDVQFSGASKGRNQTVNDVLSMSESVVISSRRPRLPSMRPRPAREEPPRRPQVSALPPEIPGKSGVSATTLAIPLPDHGAAIQVTQSLLSPGESATITVKYRESR
jgi:hypothetical protein